MEDDKAVARCGRFVRIPFRHLFINPPNLGAYFPTFLILASWLCLLRELSFDGNMRRR